MIYHGARHDLEKLITTHLFVISPNNSGSTFVKNVLATCPTTWNLRREGQHAFGFPGPNPVKLKFPYLWASEPHYLDVLADPAAFDWAAAQKTWYFQAFSASPDACVFVEKSPPFLLQVAGLSQHFAHAKFLFMTRNPYAVAEGIIRATGSFYPSRQLALEKAAVHLIKCFQVQRENIDQFSDRGLFFTYETLCENPARLEKEILALVPDLGNLTLQQKIAVKGNYDEPLRDMNADQIARLAPAEIDFLNTAFADHRELLQSFGYDLMG